MNSRTKSPARSYPFITMSHLPKYPPTFLSPLLSTAAIMSLFLVAPVFADTCWAPFRWNSVFGLGLPAFGCAVLGYILAKGIGTRIFAAVSLIVSALALIYLMQSAIYRSHW